MAKSRPPMALRSSIRASLVAKALRVARWRVSVDGKVPNQEVMSEDFKPKEKKTVFSADLKLIHPIIYGAFFYTDLYCVVGFRRNLHLLFKMFICCISLLPPFASNPVVPTKTPKYGNTCCLSIRVNDYPKHVPNAPNVWNI